MVILFKVSKTYWDKHNLFQTKHYCFWSIYISICSYFSNKVRHHYRTTAMSTIHFNSQELSTNFFLIIYVFPQRYCGLECYILWSLFFLPNIMLLEFTPMISSLLCYIIFHWLTALRFMVCLSINLGEFPIFSQWEQRIATDTLNASLLEYLGKCFPWDSVQIFKFIKWKLFVEWGKKWVIRSTLSDMCSTIASWMRWGAMLMMFAMSSFLIINEVVNILIIFTVSSHDHYHMIFLFLKYLFFFCWLMYL